MNESAAQVNKLVLQKKRCRGHACAMPADRGDRKDALATFLTHSVSASSRDGHARKILPVNVVNVFALSPFEDISF